MNARFTASRKLVYESVQQFKKGIDRLVTHLKEETFSGIDYALKSIVKEKVHVENLIDQTKRLRRKIETYYFHFVDLELDKILEKLRNQWRKGNQLIRSNFFSFEKNPNERLLKIKTN